MAKQTKLNYLIDIQVNHLPSLDDIKYHKTNRFGVRYDYRTITESAILDALSAVSKGTKYELICNELVASAKKIFAYYYGDEYEN